MFNVDFEKIVENNNTVGPLYDKKVECLHCEHIFTSKQTRSGHSKIIKQDSDLCTYYDIENPMFYESFVCPECGFAFTKSFSKLNIAQKSKLETEYFNKIRPINLSHKRNLKQALRAFELTIVTAHILNEKNVIKANIFLRLSWIYRMMEDTEKEKLFMEKALNLYKIIFEFERPSEHKMDETLLMLLIADLHSRLDHYDEARKAFSPLLTGNGIDPKYRKKASDRWEEYKEDYKKRNPNS